MSTTAGDTSPTSPSMSTTAGDTPTSTHSVGSCSPSQKAALVIRVGLKLNFRVSVLKLLADKLEKEGFTSRQAFQHLAEDVAEKLGVPLRLAEALREEARDRPEWWKAGRLPSVKLSVSPVGEEEFPERNRSQGHSGVAVACCNEKPMHRGVASFTISRAIGADPTRGMRSKSPKYSAGAPPPVVASSRELRAVEDFFQRQASAHEKLESPRDKLGKSLHGKQLQRQGSARGDKATSLTRAETSRSPAGKGALRVSPEAALCDSKTPEISPARAPESSGARLPRSIPQEYVVQARLRADSDSEGISSAATSVATSYHSVRTLSPRGRRASPKATIPYGR